YSQTVGPLKSWVQSHTAPNMPVFVYDVDPTLYRVLEREPPRPWMPLFPWIMEGDSAQDQWLDGINAARPALAIVSAEFTGGRHLPLPDGGRSEVLLRQQYTPGPRFTIRKYSASPSQEVVVLIRK